jgi:hypothetical protein
MKRISTRSTVVYKRIVPLLWFGVIALGAITTLFESRRNQALLLMLVAPVLMAGFGYLLFRRLVFDLVDEVWDDGDALLIRNAGIEERVPLRNIINIGFSTLVNPERVTLSIRQPGALGREITFCPLSRFLPFSRNPVIDELIERVDQARSAGT